MKEPAPYDVCCDATKERYDRAKWALDCAQKDWIAAWQAVIREAYARSENADHQHASSETDT